MKQFSYLLLLALLVYNGSNLQAQSARNPWGLGIYPGAYSFYALEGTDLFAPEKYGTGVELSLMRRIGNYFDLGVETNFARLAHPLDSASALAADQGNYGNRSNFLSGQMALRFRLDGGGIMDKNSAFVPFFKVGVGGSSYGDFGSWSLYVPVGLGFHYHLPKTPLTITAQSNYNPHFLLPDGQEMIGVLHHSIGLTVQLGKTQKKTDNTEFIELAKQEGPKAPDRDYDGVPDENDLCPDIYGSQKTMGCPDSDGDGIKDIDDKCPQQAGFANLEGCADSDYDGIIDPEDDCPDIYSENENGCPDGMGGGEDADGDGIADADDLCPNEAGSFTANGCPDADGDGVQDALDMCPDYYGTDEYAGCPMPKDQLDSLKALVDAVRTQSDFNEKGYTTTNGGKTIQDKFGNVLEIDVDGNIMNAKTEEKLTTTGGYRLEKGQILNENDEVMNIGDDGFLYANGQKVDTENNLWAWGSNPDPSGARTGGISLGNPVSDKFANSNLTGYAPVKQLSPQEAAYCQQLDLNELRAAIYFDYDAGQADANSLRALNRIVEAMRRCAILELQVAGHADADGSEVYNLELSERRAKSILRYISGAGVDDRRLKFNAYGERYPIAPNVEGSKSKNRRAEIRVQRAY